MNRLASFAFASLLMLASSAAAKADDVAVEEIAKQAEKDAGAARYEEAIAGYERAWEMSGAPKYLYNVSILYLARVEEPLKAWEYAMRFKDAAKSERDVEDAAKLVGMAESELLKRFGKVVVDARPRNCESWLDYRSQASLIRWKTAWAAPGVHTVIGRAGGHEEGRAEVRVVKGGTVKAGLVLKKSLATLRIRSNVEGTEVWIDNKEAGKAGNTALELRVEPGEHHLRATRDGYRQLEQVLVLAAGEKRALKAKLSELPKVAPKPVEPAVTLAKEAAPEPDRTWAWVSFGGSGAALIAGTVLYFVGRKEVLSAGDLSVADFPEGPDSYNSAFDSRVNKGKRELYAGYACWGLSGAALVTAIALYFTADDVGQTAGIAPLGPGGPGMTASLRW